MSRGPRIGDAGRAAERKTAKRMGMKQTPASGAAGAKGDFQDERFLLEMKSTTSDRYALTPQVLEKIHHEALMADKLPGFVVSFTDLAGDSKPNQTWVAVPLWVWDMLTLKEET